MWSRELFIAVQSVGRKLHLSAEVQRTINSLGLQRLHRRGCRAGRHVRLRSGRLATTETITSGNSVVQYRPIPVFISRRRSAVDSSKCVMPPSRTSVITTVAFQADACQDRPSYGPPSLYVFNAAAMTKPHAAENLAADLTGCMTDIAVVTETHLKKKHSDHHFCIDGYSMFRLDRIGRKGGVLPSM